VAEIVTAHVINHAGRGGLLAVDDQDRDRISSMVRITMRRFDIVLLAFCIMSTHYHLLVRTGKEALAKAMQVLDYLYTVYFNERHGGRGHVFEGPYRPHPKETDHQILSILRYIHLNPLDALPPGGKLDEYRWSSHPAYLGLAPWDGVDGSLLTRLSSNLDESRETYRRFVADGIPSFRAASRRKAGLPSRDGVRTRGAWRRSALHELAFYLEELHGAWPGLPPALQRRLRNCPQKAMVLYAAVTAGLGGIRQIASLQKMASSTAHRWIATLSELADRPEVTAFFDDWRAIALQPAQSVEVGQ
jgi:REP element-mobilizing transposase RayT